MNDRQKKRLVLRALPNKCLGCGFIVEDIDYDGKPMYGCDQTECQKVEILTERRTKNEML